MTDPLPAPPRAEPRPYRYERHGYAIEDPYAWLRDPAYPKVEDKDILAYLKAENAYFKTVRSESPKGLETIDMARRALHNEAAELLQESLKGRIDMDFDTARRLFTLICVLHIK